MIKKIKTLSLTHRHHFHAGARQQFNHFINLKISTISIKQIKGARVAQLVRAAVCGTEGRQFESVPVYQKMKKEKKLKPPKELPSGFDDRQEKELLIRDFVISKI